MKTLVKSKKNDRKGQEYCEKEILDYYHCELPNETIKQ